MTPEEVAAARAETAARVRRRARWLAGTLVTATPADGAHPCSTRGAEQRREHDRQVEAIIAALAVEQHSRRPREGVGAGGGAPVDRD